MNNDSERQTVNDGFEHLIVDDDDGSESLNLNDASKRLNTNNEL